jgi:CheY-like chemotaxis protein
MTTEIDRLQSLDGSKTRRLSKTVAVVSTTPHVSLLDAVLDEGDYDVVFIESGNHAYSHIKNSSPDVVILCLDMDDESGFQILSMLTLDTATSQIPVITYVTEPSAMRASDGSFGIDRELLAQPIILSMN